MCIEEADTINFELFLFDAEPTNHADNAALALVTGDLPKLIGVVKFNNSAKILGATTMVHYVPATETVMPYVCGPSSTLLYGLLVTRSAYTPVSAAKVHLRLGLELD